MRRSGQAWFALAIVMAGIWAVLATVGWSIQTAMYPRVVGVPLIILAVIELVLSLRGAPEGERQAVDTALTESLTPDITMRRTLIAFAWLIGFFLGIVLLGFPLAIPIFMVAYLRGQGREPWILSIALAAVAWLFFELIFDRVLHLPFGEGLLLQLLGR